MSSSDKKPIAVKLFVDKAKNKVVFMEASNDLLDILLSFLTLPLGTIVRLLDKHSSIGCIDQIYKSVENLESSHFSLDLRKDMLLHPRNNAQEMLKKLKINLDDTEELIAHSDMFYSFPKNLRTHILSDKNMKYIIKDDLAIGVLSTHAALELLWNQDIHHYTLFDSDLSIGSKEILKILQRSIVSKTPLTDVFFGFNDDDDANGCDCDHSKTGVIIQKQESNDRKKNRMKVYRKKLDGKLLYVEAKEGFVEQLFTYLTLPLGCVVRLLNEKSDMGSVDNLYCSVKNLGSLNVFQNFEVSKRIFLDPVVPYLYGSREQLLSVEEEKYRVSYMSNYHYDNNRVLEERKFIDSNADFMVTDELEVKSLSNTASLFSFFRNAGVSSGQVKETEVAVGKFEALTLLKACLTTKTPLTTVFGGSAA